MRKLLRQIHTCEMHFSVSPKEYIGNLTMSKFQGNVPVMFKITKILLFFKKCEDHSTTSCYIWLQNTKIHALFFSIIRKTFLNELTWRRGLGMRKYTHTYINELSRNRIQMTKKEGATWERANLRWVTD